MARGAMNQRLKDLRFHVAEAMRALSQCPGDDDCLRAQRVNDFSDEECERLADALRTLVDDEGYQCEQCEVVFVEGVTPSSHPICTFCADGEVQSRRDAEVDQRRHDMGAGL